MHFNEKASDVYEQKISLLRLFSVSSMYLYLGQNSGKDFAVLHDSLCDIPGFCFDG